VALLNTVISTNIIPVFRIIVSYKLAQFVGITEPIKLPYYACKGQYFLLMMSNVWTRKYTQSLETETASKMWQISFYSDNSRNAMLANLCEEHEGQTTLVSTDLCNGCHIWLHISVTYRLNAAITRQLYMVMVLSLCSTSTNSWETADTVWTGNLSITCCRYLQHKKCE
jgi:hypothetical protein